MPDLTKIPRRVRSRWLALDAEGRFWEPSFPEGVTPESLAIAGLLGKAPRYFMRRVEWQEAPAWAFWSRGRWERTGETWEFDDPALFEIVSRREVSPPPIPPRFASLAAGGRP